MKLQIIFRISLFLGAFATMALSNAVVPVLNSIASDPAIQGAVYSAYFLGAFLMVFPAGWMSDRVGRTPLVRAGLCGTLIAAAVLWLSYPDPTAAVLLRFAEGLFTGMFISAAMAFVNSAADHRKLAGGFVALMNIGMVAGLVVSGWLAAWQAYAGVLVFGILTCVSVLLSLGPADETPALQTVLPVAEVTEIAVYHKWLWAALFVFCGTTGVVISAYPELSGSSAEMNGVCVCRIPNADRRLPFRSERRRHFSWGVRSDSIGTPGRNDLCGSSIWCDYCCNFKLSCGDKKTAGSDERDVQHDTVCGDGCTAVCRRAAGPADRVRRGVSDCCSTECSGRAAGRPLSLLCTPHTMKDPFGNDPEKRS